MYLGVLTELGAYVGGGVAIGSEDLMVPVVCIQQNDLLHLISIGRGNKSAELGM
jgi:hypothetical protein